MRARWLFVPLLFATAGIGPCSSQNLGRVGNGTPCSYAGAQRSPGSSFASTDGCNTCSCLSDGEVACTLLACNHDAGPPPALDGSAGPTVAACGGGAPTDSAGGWIVFDSDRTDFNRDIYKIRPDGSSLTRLTTAPGIDKEPSVSPDGRWMTFTSDRSGSLQIHLMDLTSQAITQLTQRAEGADESSLSHDGSLVAFHSGASVYVVHRDGTGTTLVATGLNTLNAYFWPHFSLDDQQLVFDRNNEIDAVALDGSGLRMVVQNTTVFMKSPSVSPTTGDVAYQAQCGLGSTVEGYSIWTTSFSQTTSVCGGRRITPASDPSAERPAWGPSDVFAYERVDTVNNVGAIALISRTPGSVPCVLTPDLADNRNPAWSP